MLAAAGPAEEIAGFTVGQPHEIPGLVAGHIEAGADEVIFSFPFCARRGIPVPGDEIPSSLDSLPERPHCNGEEGTVLHGTAGCVRPSLNPLTSPGSGSTIGMPDLARNRGAILCLRVTVPTTGARPCTGQVRAWRSTAIGISFPRNDAPLAVRSLPSRLPESHSWLACGASVAAR